MKRTPRLLTSVLALVLALVPSATCLMGAEATEAEKACCAAMNHDCDGMSVEPDCCAVTSPAPIGLLASSSPGSHLALPALVAVSTIAVQPQHAPSFVGLAAFGANRSYQSNRPTYLVVSVFRL